TAPTPLYHLSLHDAHPICMLLGPFALGWIGIASGEMVTSLGSVTTATDTLDSVYEILAQLGVIVLLFLVGLETRLSDILHVGPRSEEHTSELQSLAYLVCR